MRCLRLAVVAVLGLLGSVSFGRTDFIYSSCLAFVRVKINDTDGLLFLVDSGANKSAIDGRCLRDLGIPTHGSAQVQGTVGTIRSSLAMLESLSVGDAAVRNLEVTTLDLSGYLQPEGERVSGILGYDFLRYFSMTMDFAKKQVTFVRSATKTPDAMMGIPFLLDNGVPRFKATLNGQIAAEFRLDTGASLFETKDIYVNILSDTWDKLCAAEPGLKPETYFKGSGIGGEVDLPVARAKSLALDGLDIKTPFVIVQPRQGYFANKNAAGLISNNLLEKFSPVIVDYPGKKLCLTRK